MIETDPSWNVGEIDEIGWGGLFAPGSFERTLWDASPLGITINTALGHRNIFQNPSLNPNLNSNPNSSSFFSRGSNKYLMYAAVAVGAIALLVGGYFLLKRR